MIADCDSLPKNVDAYDQEYNARPTKEIREQCGGAKQVNQQDGDSVSPIQAIWNYWGWNWIAHVFFQAFSKFGRVRFAQRGVPDVSQERVARMGRGLLFTSCQEGAIVP
jgi:hypothetical protein